MLSQPTVFTNYENMHFTQLALTFIALSQLGNAFALPKTVPDPATEAKEELKIEARQGLVVSGVRLLLLLPRDIY